MSRVNPRAACRPCMIGRRRYCGVAGRACLTPTIPGVSAPGEESAARTSFARFDVLSQSFSAAAVLSSLVQSSLFLFYLHARSPDVCAWSILIPPTSSLHVRWQPLATRAFRLDICQFLPATASFVPYTPEPRSSRYPRESRPPYLKRKAPPRVNARKAPSGLDESVAASAVHQDRMLDHIRSTRHILHHTK